DVPVAPGRPHERRQYPLGVDHRGPEGPGVGAELGQRDREDHEQDAEQGPGPIPAEALAHVASVASAADGAAPSARRAERKPAPTPSTTQVIGSSRKPL